MKIYVDMDGVLANFDKRYEELFGKRPEDPEKDKEHFWSNWETFVNGNNFATLELHPDAKAILGAVRALNVPYEILSSSGSGSGPLRDMVIAQKMTWLEKHGIDCPAHFTPGGKYKAQYATPDSVLIDDLEKNIELFNASGGCGIHHTNAIKTIIELIACYSKLGDNDILKLETACE